MNFITLDVKTGQIVNIDSYLTQYLKEHDCIQYYDRPTTGPYLILIQIQNMSWFYQFTENKHVFLNPFNIHYEILSDLYNRNAFIIITTEAESFASIPKQLGWEVRRLDDNRDIVHHLKNTIKHFNINEKSILYLDSNYRIEKLLNRHELNGLWFNIWERFYEPIDSTSIITSIKNKIKREKKFLYLGGKGRDYRLQFVDQLLKIPNLKEDSFLSTGSGNFLDFFTKENKHQPSVILDNSEVNSLSEKVASCITDFHQRSYFNIIPMSSFYTQHNHLEITEKFFKPIVNLQPFISLGEPGTLAMLKDLGYKTFDKWIDESYDTTLDDNARFIKVLEEVKRLNSLSYDHMSEMLLDMLPILEYNANLNKDRYHKKDYSLLTKILNIFDQYR